MYSSKFGKLEAIGALLEKHKTLKITKKQHKTTEPQCDLYKTPPQTTAQTHAFTQTTMF